MQAAPDTPTNSISRFLEKASIRRIVIVWMGIVLLFTAIYFLLALFYPGSTKDNGVPVQPTPSGFATLAYFSIITATTTGYGDVLPIGISRPFATIEAILGFAIMSIVISKLVSSKQDLIMGELYHLSHDENINKVRSALYLIRSDFTRMNDKWVIETYNAGNAKKFWVSLITLDTLLADAQRLVCKPHQHLKEIDPLRLELLFNSIDMTINKLVSAIGKLDAKGIPWRTGAINDRLESIIRHLKDLTEHYRLRKVSAKTKEKIVFTEELADQLSTLRKPSQKTGETQNL